MAGDLSDGDYEALLAFRTGLRRFLRWSEQQARAVGLTGSQHQLLLAVRGLPGDPTMGEVAEQLVTRHHSVVGLVDRAEAAGLVERVRTSGDHRVVQLRLTEEGAARLARLSALHREELARLGSRLAPPWQEPTEGDGG